MDGSGGTAATTVNIAVECSDDPINSWTANTLPVTGNLSFATFGAGGTVVGRAAGESNWVKAGDIGTRQRLFGGALGQWTRVAVGWLGTVALSEEGGAWRLAKGVDFLNMEDVIHDGDRFVTVSKGGKVGLSEDGTVWAFHESATKNWLKHITHGDGLYVAVGIKGTIVTSVNGTDWMAHNSPTTSGLESVTFGNGLYVAVGFKGTILHSNNGRQWSAAKSGTKDWLNDVVRWKVVDAAQLRHGDHARRGGVL